MSQYDRNRALTDRAYEKFNHFAGGYFGGLPYGMSRTAIDMVAEMMKYDRLALRAIKYQGRLLRVAKMCQIVMETVKNAEICLR